MDSGWIDIKNSPIAAGDEPVIVWHVHNGVMVERRDHAQRNRFVTHWREIETGAWIDAGDRKPTSKDADVYSCVISLNKCGDVSTAGWHRFWNETSLIRWQHTPEPPANYLELRRNAQ